MRILFVVPYTPNAIRVRPFQLIRGLAACGHRITVATLWEDDAERNDLESLGAIHNVRVIARPLTRLRKLRNLAKAFLTDAPLQARYCWDPRLAAAISTEVARAANSVDAYAAFHVEHLRGSAYAFHLQSRGAAPLLWDAVDCISDLFAQAAQQSRSPRARLMTGLELERTRRYEVRLLESFPCITVTSVEDHRALCALPGAPAQAPVTVVPNGVDLDHFTPHYGPRQPNTLVVTGKMSYHANVTMVLHLVNDIMPHVWSARPDARVWIVGKDPPPVVRGLGESSGATTDGEPRILVTGAVADIRPFLHQATLAVAPVVYGAGIQNKVLEAMACAAPVVASSRATAALMERGGTALMTADNPLVFARTIVELLDNQERCRILGAAGRAYVERWHTWKAAALKLTTLYAQGQGINQ